MKNIKYLIYFVLAFLISNLSFSQDLNLPQDWDDSYITLIKQGKPIKKNIGLIGISGYAETNDGKFIINIDEYLVTALSLTNKFDIEVMDTNTLKEIEIISNMQTISELNEDQLISIGEKKGVEYMVQGSVNSASHTLTKKFAYDLLTVKVGITAKLIDISSKRLVMSKSAEGITDVKIYTSSSGAVIRAPKDLNNDYVDATKKAIINAVNLISQQFSVVGQVANVKPDNILITVGSDQGLKKGSKLLVVKPGNPITNPSNPDEILSYDKEVIARINVISVEKNISKCEIDKLTDKKNTISVGDIVVLIKEY